MLMRWVIGIGSWAVLWLSTKIAMIGHKKDQPLKGFRKWYIQFTVATCAKICMICLGCFFINIKNVHVDYEEYLGADWNKNGVDFDKCGSTVVNHQSWIDILVNMYRQIPSHVAKAATTKIPFVGSVAAAVGCLFFDRGDKGQRKDLLTMMSDRQILSEENIWPPLIMNVEGGTTNGTSLIKFKKGAFVGLNSVQPVVIKY
jgi:lysophosphatidylcholine acyltransferase/lyso-PAF acetyltransferase